jgi:energy-coupling factor transport system substrate-specific component
VQASTRNLLLVAAVLLVAALASSDAALVTAGVAWFESGPDSTRELVVVATLGSAAAAGRVLFSALPGVQPVTVVAVVAGVALGLRAGVATGAIAAFVSNLFLGQGVWTPQQMLGWAACGAVGALLAPALRRRVPLAVVCFVLGLLFSAIMDLWLWYGFFPHTTASLVVVLGRGLWFDLSHAVGNFVLALAIGPELRRMLERYRSRLRTEVVWT